MNKFPKLKKMIVRNFRAIKNDIEIDLNDIVILVGSNNCGKSTILKAYECAVNSEKLTIDDFHKCEIDIENLPEVEIHTIVNTDSAPKIEHWCAPYGENYIVKEKWLWKKANDKPERVGYRVDLDRWALQTDSPKMPWAMDNVAYARRPKPHRVSTFDSPETQSDAIKDIINSMLEEKIKDFEPKSKDNNFGNLKSKFETLKKEFTEASKEEVKNISNDITNIIHRIIPNHEFSFSIDDALKDDPFQIFDSKDINIKFGEKDKLFPLLNHGSGARRTLLWAILKKMAEMGFEAKASKSKRFEKISNSESHILLMDEPEISLHPYAIREACGVLYNLPNNNIWQVMITTHSPQFIDLTKDHTTIVRVEKVNDKDIESTTLFKTDEISLTTDEKENLKLLNLIDPFVLEFFFGGKVLIVEGDTEYSAFNYIKLKERENNCNVYDDLHIIRARGKVQVASLMKILNHFKKDYFVLHDTDTPKTTRKKKTKCDDGKYKIEKQEITNPAWTNNVKILNNMGSNSKVFASLINFEFAYFEETISSGKPINSIEKLKETTNYQKIKAILDYILFDIPTNENIIKWNKINDLTSFIDEKL